MYLSKCEVVPLGLSQVRITGPCVVTGEVTSVIAPLDGLQRWMRGEMHIQDALPDLSAADREFLISGTSDKGWKKIFGDEDECLIGGPDQDDI